MNLEHLKMVDFIFENHEVMHIDAEDIIYMQLRGINSNSIWSSKYRYKDYNSLNEFEICLSISANTEYNPHELDDSISKFARLMECNDIEIVKVYADTTEEFAVIWAPNCDLNNTWQYSKLLGKSGDLLIKIGENVWK